MHALFQLKPLLQSSDFTIKTSLIWYIKLPELAVRHLHNANCFAPAAICLI